MLHKCRYIGYIMPPKGLVLSIVYCILRTMLPKRVFISQWELAGRRDGDYVR